MSFEVDHIIAKSHTPEYSIHKYWSRKPHNVIRKLLGDHLSGLPAKTFIDPFCGSGVTLAEALRYGAHVFGGDINPVAALLSEVTCAPPPAVRLEDALERLIDDFSKRFGDGYRLSSGDEIRYLVHALTVKCQCGLMVAQGQTQKKGRTYLCPGCSSRVSFNLQHNVRTQILQIRTTSGKIVRCSESDAAKSECLSQEQFADTHAEAVDGRDLETYDCAMVPNGRVLAFPGMYISDLFTPRAFRAATWLFDAAESIEDDSTRKACLLFLTSSVVQFSRLIPCRNELTTGGPAWTVPGFWVAPVHLETNPVVHLRARKRKFLHGIKNLPRAGSAPAVVKCEDAVDLIEELKSCGRTADLIFLDPPYGDSVPYLEFSAIWNAMLKQPSRFDREVVISNRTEFPSNWDTYRQRLGRIICLCSDILNSDGKILVTFNNLDYQSWYALLRPIHHSGLRCSKVHYQVPAVVSAKAQFSPENSYQGDFYCEFSKAAGRDEEVIDIDRLVQVAVAKVLKSRRGRAATSLVQRAVVLSVLRWNLEPEILLRIESLIASTARKEGSQYVLVCEPPGLEDVLDLSETVRKIAADCLASAGLDWDELYKRILDTTEPLGVPAEKEAREILDDLVYFGPRCRLKADAEQGVLFG